MAACVKYNKGCAYYLVPAAGPWLGSVTANQDVSEIGLPR